jgi:hypothetical protein
MSKKLQEIGNQSFLSQGYSHGIALLDAKLNELRGELNYISSQLLLDFSEAAYCDAIRNMPLTVSYHIIPTAVQESINRIKDKYGEQAVLLFHKLTLCNFMKQSLMLLRAEDIFPESIVSYYDRHFEWIWKHLFCSDSRDLSYYSYTNDLFLKDLNICSLKMFPFGAQVVELAPISRKFIISYGFKQLIRSSYFYLSGIQFPSPFYHVHLDERWIGEFNRKGWYRYFKVTAEMLKRHPHVRGVFGSSWFYDPCLEKISPGLIYLRKIPELGGAKVFKFESTLMDIQNATRKSDRRAKLYMEGKYIPTSYIFIWPRDALIRWSDKSPDDF